MKHYRLFLLLIGLLVLAFLADIATEALACLYVTYGILLSVATITLSTGKSS